MKFLSLWFLDIISITELYIFPHPLKVVLWLLNTYRWKLWYMIRNSLKFLLSFLTAIIFLTIFLAEIIFPLFFLAIFITFNRNYFTTLFDVMWTFCVFKSNKLFCECFCAQRNKKLVWNKVEKTVKKKVLKKNIC